MTTAINFKDIVEKNGKTIEQNNLAAGHKYPIGTLVSFTTEDYQGDGPKGICGTKTSGNLFVMEHCRDCDGSPLYLLGSMDLSKPGNQQAYDECGNGLNDHARRIYKKGLFGMIFNFGEESLTPVPKPECTCADPKPNGWPRTHMHNCPVVAR